MQFKKLKGRSASYILLYLAIAGGIILAGPKLPLVPEGTRWENVIPHHTTTPPGGNGETVSAPQQASPSAATR